jgi:hypothetical protein
LNGAIVGHKFEFGRAAVGKRDELLVGLLLVVLEAGKPSFEAMFLLAYQVIDNHVTASPKY